MTTGALPVNFDFLPALPEIALLVGACLVLLVDLVLPETRRSWSYWLTQLTVVTTAWLSLYVFHESPAHTFGNTFIADALADVLKFLSCVTVALTLAYSRSYLAARGLFRGETFALMMFALLGMMVMISAGNFITLYMGLELHSLSLYALVAMHRKSKQAS